MSKAADEAAQGLNMRAAQEINSSFKRYALHTGHLMEMRSDEVYRGAI